MMAAQDATASRNEHTWETGEIVWSSDVDMPVFTIDNADSSFQYSRHNDWAVIYVAPFQSLITQFHNNIVHSSLAGRFIILTWAFAGDREKYQKPGHTYRYYERQYEGVPGQIWYDTAYLMSDICDSIITVKLQPLSL